MSNKKKSPSKTREVENSFEMELKTISLGKCSIYMQTGVTSKWKTAETRLYVTILPY